MVSLTRGVNGFNPRRGTRVKPAGSVTRSHLSNPYPWMVGAGFSAVPHTLEPAPKNPLVCEDIEGFEIKFWRELWSFWRFFGVAERFSRYVRNRWASTKHKHGLTEGSGKVLDPLKTRGFAGSNPRDRGFTRVPARVDAEINPLTPLMWGLFWRRVMGVLCWEYERCKIKM